MSGTIITFSLICDKCTRTRAFHGASRHDCKVRAMRAGWVQENGQDVCPTCPARRVRLCTFESDLPCDREQYYPQRQQRRRWESDSWCKEHLEANRPEWPKLDTSKIEHDVRIEY